MLLASALQPGTIRFGHRVRHIITRQCSVADRQAGCLTLGFDDGSSAGPFDLVVAADGLAGSICARHSSSYKSVCDRLAIIGDARWARPRFWDLGMAQRARGADVALQDGARLGVSILEDIQAHATLISGGKRPLTPWMPSRLRLGFFAAQPPSFCARHSRKVVLLLLIVLVGWGRTIGEVRPCRN